MRTSRRRRPRLANLPSVNTGEAARRYLHLDREPRRLWVQRPVPGATTKQRPARAGGADILNGGGGFDAGLVRQCRIRALRPSLANPSVNTGDAGGRHLPRHRERCMVPISLDNLTGDDQQQLAARQQRRRSHSTAARASITHFYDFAPAGVTGIAGQSLDQHGLCCRRHLYLDRGTGWYLHLRSFRRRRQFKRPCGRGRSQKSDGGGGSDVAFS